jgi:hypothetical protein
MHLINAAIFVPEMHIRDKKNSKNKRGRKTTKSKRNLANIRSQYGDIKE